MSFELFEYIAPPDWRQRLFTKLQLKKETLFRLLIRNMPPLRLSGETAFPKLNRQYENSEELLDVDG